MPARMPRGMEMREAMKTRIALPTRALEMPPPASPMGRGRLTRKPQFIAEMPFFIMKERIRNMGSMQIKARTIIRPLNSLSATILLCRCLSFISPLHAHFDDDNLPGDVDKGRDHEEHKGYLGEARKIDVARCFRKLVGDDARHGIGG